MTPNMASAGGPPASGRASIGFAAGRQRQGRQIDLVRRKVAAAGDGQIPGRIGKTLAGLLGVVQVEIMAVHPGLRIPPRGGYGPLCPPRRRAQDSLHRAFIQVFQPGDQQLFLRTRRQCVMRGHIIRSASERAVAATKLQSSRPRGELAMSHTVVIFGASGDLTGRKLIPALYEESFSGPPESTAWMARHGREWFDYCPVLK